MVRQSGATYLVYDHALLDCFDQFERFAKPGLPLSLVAAALHRAFAESARDAQLVALYLFYVHRASEIASLFADAPPDPSSELDRRWQTLLILFHEAGHAVPSGHEAREAIDLQALLLASGMLTEQIAGLNGSLSGLLGDNPLGNQAQAAQDNWKVIRDDLNIGDDAISDTLHAVAVDSRFHREIASDSFALAAIRNALAAETASLDEDRARALVRTALLAVSRGLLHMRLLAYLDSVAGNLPDHLDSAHVNPLRLQAMVEMGFRSNITIREIVQIAVDLCGDTFATELREDLAAQQIGHTTSLFEAASVLMESTLVSPAFHGRLAGLLAEDGIDVAVVQDDVLEAVASGDAIWYELAARV
jgi:hypothetical protein